MTRAQAAAAITLILVFFAAIGWYEIAMWRECRAHGFSVLYCLPGRR